MVRSMRTRLCSAARGFSLVELLVVIAIVVIGLGLGVPAFKQTIAGQRVKSAAFDLFSALTYARSEAVMRNATISVKAGAATAGGWTTGWRVENSAGSVLRSWAATNNLTITETVSGATVVSYGVDGRLSSSTANAPKLQVSPVTTINGVSSRCVSVDLSGRPNSQTGSCS